jgi:hypothetical protein
MASLLLLYPSAVGFTHLVLSRAGIPAFPAAGILTVDKFIFLDD